MGTSSPPPPCVCYTFFYTPGFLPPLFSHLMGMGSPAWWMLFLLLVALFALHILCCVLLLCCHAHHFLLLCIFVPFCAACTCTSMCAFTITSFFLSFFICNFFLEGMHRDSAFYLSLSLLSISRLFHVYLFTVAPWLVWVMGEYWWWVTMPGQCSATACCPNHSPLPCTHASERLADSVALGTSGACMFFFCL